MEQTQTSQDQESDRPPRSESVSIPAATSRTAHKGARKRTKTGCLTCRKRRVKCGEERPICNNCTKSKRACEGYNQRVVFKHPSGAENLPGHHLNSVTPIPLARSLAPGYPAVFPYPMSNEPYAPSYGPDPRSYYGHYYGHGSAPPGYQPQVDRNIRLTPTASSQSGYPSQVPPPPAGMWDGQNDVETHRHSVGYNSSSTYADQSRRNIPGPWYNAYGTDTSGIRDTEQSEGLPYSTLHHNYVPESAPQHAQAQYAVPSAHPSRHLGSVSDDWQSISPPSASATNGIPLSFKSNSSHVPTAQGQPQLSRQGTSLSDLDEQQHSVYGFVPQPFFDVSIPPSTSSLPAPATILSQDDADEDEEDPWDVEMELEQDEHTTADVAHTQLAVMLKQHTSRDVARARTYRAFLNTANILATYRPSQTTSPLTNEDTARIFCHFVTITGASMSIFERPASNQATSLGPIPLPTSRSPLWTYTLPTIALSHPPLMHAMLALSALHISKLQLTSEGPSMKHFTYALRRVSKLIGLPKRRNEISTLAANLLLGFYEVMLADHSKWNIHLGGAKILVMEIDFASMTRRLRRMRMQAKGRIAHVPALSYVDYIRIAGIPPMLLPDADWEIDEDLVSDLTGFHIRYDNPRQANTGSRLGGDQDLTLKDIEDYKVQSDLFWWYCKQDIFQSMVSSNRLLMPYEHWINCPPRGQIGKIESTYATMDYLCLIMARITDFGGKDRARKQRVIRAQGGQWRPAPGFLSPANAPRPPQSMRPNPTKPDPSSTPSANSDHGLRRLSMPSNASGAPLPGQVPSVGEPTPMYSMMPPPTHPIQMHSAYNAMDTALHDTGFKPPSPPPSPSPDSSTNLDDATTAALAEHSSISRAFDLFAAALGADYAPLPPDTITPISTPFGPALQYRTYPIACTWAFYHVGRILLHRLHPHAPPAAMVAAGVTAHLTQAHAQAVGKICAGLYCPQSYSLQTGNLNPSLGGALMESTFSLFFAAVQYTDPVQRGWTIAKLNDIVRLTGWQSSSAIAAGCEICWERMGKLGKGPEYVPTLDTKKNKDERMERWRMEKEGKGGEGGMKKEKNDKVVEEEETPLAINHDRRFISVNPSARVHWALGLLGVEDDMKKLEIEK